MLEIYGPEFAEPKGYIAHVGSSECHHSFGGQSWTISDPMGIIGGPTLLLTLDLSDPRLNDLGVSGLPSLPLCSYINSNVLREPQIYQIDSLKHQVLLIQKGTMEVEIYDNPGFTNPLPEKAIYLLEMSPEHYPIDEDSYYNAMEIFFGSGDFIRISGPPLWMDTLTADCDCGSLMKYIASIGWEGKSHGFIDDGHFYIGECALYFLLCSTCLKFAVIADGT